MDIYTAALRRMVENIKSNREKPPGERDYSISPEQIAVGMDMGMAGMGTINKVTSMMTPEADMLRKVIQRDNALNKVNEPQGKLIKVEGGGLRDIRDAQVSFKDDLISKVEREYDALEFNGLDSRIPVHERMYHYQKALDKAQEAKSLSKRPMWDREIDYWTSKIQDKGE